MRPTKRLIGFAVIRDNRCGNLTVSQVNEVIQATGLGGVTRRRLDALSLAALTW